MKVLSILLPFYRGISRSTSAIANHTSKPLDIASSGITLIFWGKAKQTTIVESKRPYLFKNMGQLSMSMSEVKS